MLNDNGISVFLASRDARADAAAMASGEESVVPRQPTSWESTSFRGAVKSAERPSDFFVWEIDPSGHLVTLDSPPPPPPADLDAAMSSGAGAGAGAGAQDASTASAGLREWEPQDTADETSARRVLRQVFGDAGASELDRFAAALHPADAAWDSARTAGPGAKPQQQVQLAVQRVASAGREQGACKALRRDVHMSVATLSPWVQSKYVKPQAGHGAGAGSFEFSRCARFDELRPLLSADDYVRLLRFVARGGEEPAARGGLKVRVLTTAFVETAPAPHLGQGGRAQDVASDGAPADVELPRHTADSSSGAASGAGAVASELSASAAASDAAASVPVSAAAAKAARTAFHRIVARLLPQLNSRVTNGGRGGSGRGWGGGGGGDASSGKHKHTDARRVTPPSTATDVTLLHKPPRGPQKRRRGQGGNGIAGGKAARVDAGAVESVAASGGGAAGGADIESDGDDRAWLHFVLEKTGVEHLEAMGRLARHLSSGGTRVRVSDISTAGTKDKLAVTCQRCSVRRRPGVEARLRGLAHVAADNGGASDAGVSGVSDVSGVSGLRVSGVARAAQPVTMGALRGNRFSIAVRPPFARAKGHMAHLAFQAGHPRPLPAQVAPHGEGTAASSGANTDADADAEASARAAIEGMGPAALDADSIRVDAVAARLAAVQAHGAVNYFGTQRVGRSCQSAPAPAIGAAMLRGDWVRAVHLLLKPRPAEPDSAPAARRHWDAHRGKNARRTLELLPPAASYSRERAVLRGVLRFGRDVDGCRAALESLPFASRLQYMHAYQSLVFNKVASHRIATHGPHPVVGDLVRIPTTTGHARGHDPEGGHDASPDTARRSGTASSVRTQVHTVTSADVAAGTFSLHDVVLTLPAGPATAGVRTRARVQYPPVVEGVYRALLAADGVLLGPDADKDKGATEAEGEGSSAAGAAASGGGGATSSAQAPRAAEALHLASQRRRRADTVRLCAALRGGYRSLVVRPTDVAVLPAEAPDGPAFAGSPHPPPSADLHTAAGGSVAGVGGPCVHGVRVWFTLPASAYATVTLRELLGWPHTP